jgi:NIPSNAP
MGFSPIVELRQYTLLPGKRDDLIDLFEANFIEGQEETGMRILGTFRDLDDETKFVWLRGFPDMDERACSLADFYDGPVWQGNRDAANGTMVDSDNVLLLRPARGEADLTLAGEHPPLDAPAGTDRGVVEATILNLDARPDDETLAYFDAEIAPRVAAAASVLACLVTEYSENNFPVLPVREDEHVLAWFAGFPDRAAYDAARQARAELLRAAADSPRLASPPHVLRLVPTRRSQLTGSPPAGVAGR